MKPLKTAEEKEQIHVWVTDYAVARVDKDCPKETLVALKKLAEIAYHKKMRPCKRLTK